MAIKIFNEVDFNEIVLRTIKQASTGRFDNDFIKLLSTVGITKIPSTKRKIDLLHWLNESAAPSGRNDIERIGGPLVIAACIGLLRGEPLLASRLSENLEEALEKCKVNRKERRAQVLDGSDARASSPQDRPSVFSGSMSSLPEQINDAISLLEGAAASNNLLLRHYQRISRLSEHVRIRGKHQNTSVGASASGFSSVNPSAKFTSGSGIDGSVDATKNWAGAFRDRGQFGSHPSYDEMDDESGP